MMMVGNHTLRKAGRRVSKKGAPDAPDDMVEIVRVESLLDGDDRPERADELIPTAKAKPAQKREQNHRVARAVARWTYRIVAGALLALVLGAATVLIVIPRATHGTALTVLTGSMTPDIPVGSVVIERPVDPGTLKVGDVATYQKAPGVNEYITHRIIKIDTSKSPALFTFKGDANRGPDITPVPAGAIRGKVWFHVPYLGTWRDSISGATGRVGVIVVVVLMLGGYSVRQIRESMRDRKPAPAAGNDGPLTFDFAPGAFGSTDPAFVATLLQGELQPLDGGFRLSFHADESRRAVLADLLTPYLRPPTDEPPDGDSMSEADVLATTFAAEAATETGTKEATEPATRSKSQAKSANSKSANSKSKVKSKAKAKSAKKTQRPDAPEAETPAVAATASDENSAPSRKVVHA